MAGARFWHSRAVRHVYQCPMRWADMDLQGHVNNVIYVDYLQEARVDMLRVHAAREGTDQLAEALVVVHHEVHYRAPLTYRFQPVSIECWVTDIRAASFTMAYEVFHEEPGHPEGRRVYLRATTVLTPFIFESERPRRLSDGERSALATYVEDSPPWADPLRLRGDGRRDDVGHYPVHVRFSDVDVYGHVNNVKYFEYFMEARILLTARLWKGLVEEGMPVRMVTARTRRRLQGADPVPSRAVRRVVLADPRRRAVDGHRLGDRRRRPAARAGPGRDGVRRPRDEPPAGATARGPRTVARRSRSLVASIRAVSSPRMPSPWLTPRVQALTRAVCLVHTMARA